MTLQYAFSLSVNCLLVYIAGRGDTLITKEIHPECSCSGHASPYEGISPENFMQMDKIVGECVHTISL